MTPKSFYRVIGWLSEIGLQTTGYDKTPYRASIDAVCQHCINDIILIKREPNERYYWVGRVTRRVLAETGDRDAAEMVGMLGGVR